MDVTHAQKPIVNFAPKATDFDSVAVVLNDIVDMLKNDNSVRLILEPIDSWEEDMILICPTTFTNAELKRRPIFILQKAMLLPC